MTTDELHISSGVARGVGLSGNASAELEKARQGSKRFAALVPGGDGDVGDGKARAWAFRYFANGDALDLFVRQPNCLSDKTRVPRYSP